MGEYDAASVVGQQAGRTTPEKKVTPEDLILRFCTNVDEGLVASPGVTVERRKTTARGHCGYMGGRGDSLVTGFDDGYDWMGYLCDRGWKPLPGKGDWPYVVYLAWRDGEYAIAEYCEADLTVWRFESAEAAQEHYRGLRDCP
jgi:hypothetical protein